MSESPDYLTRQPQLENKPSLKDADDLLTVILAPIAERGFGRFQQEVQDLEDDVAKQFGKQLRTFTLFKQRIPGHVITRDSHYSIEAISLVIADASLAHALAAYNAAQKNPVDAARQKQRMEEDGLSFSFVKEHGCEAVFNHLVGKCGFEYLQGNMKDEGTYGQILLCLGEPLSRDPDDEDIFATCIIANLEMQGQK